ncbi:MAG TPA: aminopeptidase P N-terminal domain-containing protein [Burkholderiales bacterium]|jgi:Xaa-Pro aminopeptidase|nr:aminopeptidase P N-terminal domain-containing protein [Burkholderiales bacterium]
MKLTDIQPPAYAERRLRVARAMQAGVAIVPTAPERVRNRDTHYPFRFDSHFWYLTAFPEPEAVLVIVAGESPRSILFCRERSEERAIWEGFRYGPEAARERFGFDATLPIAALDEEMPKLLADQPALYYPLGADAAWDARIVKWLNTVRERERSGVTAPERVHDVRVLVDEMRLIKDRDELAIMRSAAAISGAAHRRAMQSTRPGRLENEIEAELLYEFRRRGAQFPAYSPIVAGGANACVLHYVFNDAELHDGDLLLIDAGCELQGYASDITRTFPVNGRFSGAQRAVYELVLAAQQAAMHKVREGNAWNEPHDAAVRVLAQGMIDLKLVAGSLDAVLEKETYKRFYMHRTGHWLGLDVHDAGEYKRSGAWRALLPGMVLTVEPGIYIRAAADVPQALHDIGIRIEDDVLVTRGDCEVLTAAAPKAIADIEALMRSAS